MSTLENQLLKPAHAKADSGFATATTVTDTGAVTSTGEFVGDSMFKENHLEASNPDIHANSGFQNPSEEGVTGSNVDDTANTNTSVHPSHSSGSGSSDISDSQKGDHGSKHHHGLREKIKEKVKSAFSSEPQVHDDLYSDEVIAQDNVISDPAHNGPVGPRIMKF